MGHSIGLGGLHSILTGSITYAGRLDPTPVFHVFGTTSLELWQVQLSQVELGETAGGFQTSNDGMKSNIWLSVPFNISLQYSYLTSVPLMVVFSIAMTYVKFKQGTHSLNIPRVTHEYPAGHIMLPDMSGMKHTLFRHLLRFSRQFSNPKACGLLPRWLQKLATPTLLRLQCRLGSRIVSLGAVYFVCNTDFLL